MRSVEHVLTVGQFERRFRKTLQWAFQEVMDEEVDIWNATLEHIAFNITCEIHLGPGVCDQSVTQDMRQWVRYVGTPEALGKFRVGFKYWQDWIQETC